MNDFNFDPKKKNDTIVFQQNECKKIDFYLMNNELNLTKLIPAICIERNNNNKKPKAKTYH